jgi:hypothetical protein
MTADLSAVQRVARATCTELHTRALESGYLVRGRRDPGSYRARLVWPVILAAFEAGLIKEASDG